MTKRIIVHGVPNVSAGMRDPAMILEFHPPKEQSCNTTPAATIAFERGPFRKTLRNSFFCWHGTACMAPS